MLLPRSQFNGNSWLLPCVMSCLALFFLHTLLGCNPLILIILLLTFIICASPVYKFGIFDITSIFLLLIGLRYVGIPVFAKIFFLQPLDSNLENPISSFSVVLIGSISYVASVFFAHKSFNSGPVFSPVFDPAHLSRLSFLSYAVGLIANIDMAAFAYTGSERVTYSNFFAPLIEFSLICSVAHTIMKSNGTRQISWWTLWILFNVVLFALVASVRAPIMNALISIFLTLACFKGLHLSKNHVAGTLLIVIVLIASTPIILALRGLRSDLNPYERFIAAINAVQNIDQAKDIYDMSVQIESNSPTFFMNYYGEPKNVLERFSHVNDVDVIVSGIDSHGNIGFDLFFQGFSRSLPRLFNENKVLGYGEGDWIYCYIDVKCLYGNYLTAAFIGTSYAAIGWLGPVLLPFAMTIPIFFLIKYFFGFSMRRNIWVIFIFICFNNSIVEFGIEGYFGMLMRTLPQYTCLLLILNYLSKFRL